MFPIGGLGAHLEVKISESFLMLLCPVWSAHGFPRGRFGACPEVIISESFLMLIYGSSGSAQHGWRAGFRVEVWAHVLRLTFRSRS